MKLDDVYKARERLKSTVHHTPLTRSSTFSGLCSNEIYLKSENLQKTGSFKVRGAFNKIAKLAENDDKPGLAVASSAGNHAQGVAFAAAQHGIKSCIIMPKSTPIAKINATAGYGAEVVLHGDVYDDAYNKAIEITKANGGIFIHPFDDEDVIAGQATVALEIIEDSNPDIIIVPAGGGGLLAGVAFAAKNINPKIKVIGVQAERADPIARSFLAKKHMTADNIFTIADGIAVKKPGELTVKIINEYADDVLTVSDDEIASSILQLIERTKQVVEPAGACPLALALSGRLTYKNKKTVCVMSGGNIDVGFIHKIIEKGLVSRGRQMKFSVILTDKPGSLTNFSKVMSDNNANIISVQYDRMSTEIRLNETILHIAAEVGGFDHAKKVVSSLEDSGYRVIFEETFQKQ